MKRDDVLNVRVPTEIKAALKRAADADDRSVSTMTVRILREWLAAKGYVNQALPAKRKQG